MPSQTASFDFGQTLPVGTHTLSISYHGKILEQLAGFYRSTYKDVRDGTVSEIGVTQFEATDARRALPCWDEPAVKAVFALTLVVPSNLQALSNMPVRCQTTVMDATSTDLVSVSFCDSPKMSTYLLAWIIGRFDHVSTVSDGVRVRVYL